MGFDVAEHFTPPIRLNRSVAVTAEFARRRDNDIVLMTGQARIAEAASTRFGAVDSSALRAGLYHRLVLRCGRCPERSPRAGIFYSRCWEGKRQFQADCRESCTALFHAARDLLDVYRHVNRFALG